MTLDNYVNILWYIPREAIDWIRYEKKIRSNQENLFPLFIDFSFIHFLYWKCEAYIAFDMSLNLQELKYRWPLVLIEFKYSFHCRIIFLIGFKIWMWDTHKWSDKLSKKLYILFIYFNVIKIYWSKKKHDIALLQQT